MRFFRKNRQNLRSSFPVAALGSLFLLKVLAPVFVTLSQKICSATVILSQNSKFLPCYTTDTSTARPFGGTTQTDTAPSAACRDQPQKLTTIWRDDNMKQANLQSKYQLFIDGQWRDASDGATFQTTCPANEPFWPAALRPQSRMLTMLSTPPGRLLRPGSTPPYSNGLPFSTGLPILSKKTRNIWHW